jgi:hypothetical protein
MSKKVIIIKIILILLFPISFLLGKAASISAGGVEKLYSTGLYKHLSQMQNAISGGIPFSLHELLIIIAVLLAVFLLIISIVKAVKMKRKWYKPLVSYLMTVLAAGALLYFVFTICWGLNNYRPTFAEISGLEVRASSAQELKELCISLINKTNSLRAQMDEDSNGVTTTAMSNSEIFKTALEGYENASKIYPELGGNYAAAKAVALSVPMTYTDTWGQYSAFTGEANVNVNIPVYFLPSTACHEMAHQRGFSREDEANYIGYLTCMLNSNAFFQYSGSLDALLSSMNALYSVSYDDWKELRETYSDGVSRDLAYLTSFNARYEGVVGKLSDSVNDVYLKANNQPNGVQSYGRMVDLLLAEYRKSIQ